MTSDVDGKLSAIEIRLGKLEHGFDRIEANVDMALNYLRAIARHQSAALRLGATLEADTMPAPPLTGNGADEDTLPGG